MPHKRRKRRGPHSNAETAKPAFRPSVAEKAARMLEIPADVVTGAVHLDFSGNREVLIDGCKGVVEYDENLVRVSAGNLTIRFAGRGLNLRNLTQNSAIVEGYITAVSFE